jgi:hypothetical protein
MGKPNSEANARSQSDRNDDQAQSDNKPALFQFLCQVFHVYDLPFENAERRGV